MNLSDYKLNENQRSVVDWTCGPLLVLAGPGSGKTLVLTLRAAKLLTAEPEASVLALTFTTKAADEMRERLDQLMGGRAEQAHLCTFHSFAGDILRQHGSHVGIQPDFSVITIDDDRIAILESVIGNLECDVSALPTDRKNLLLLLDRLFSESYDGEAEASSMLRTPPWLPHVFRGYCDALQQSNRLDYGALLYFARKLLVVNKGVLRLTQIAWQYVCIDEFQDTNRAQYDLLKLLVPENEPNLLVVADDDQIIYQWNGASPERLRALREDYAMKVIQLPENFRCPPEIICLANNLIVHNKNRSEGKNRLEAWKSESDTTVIKVKVFKDEDDEVAMIPDVITKARWSTADCAVLARTTKLLQKAASALSEANITPYLAQRKTEFQSPSAFWMYTVLRLANARHDREFLRRTCVAWEQFADVTIEVEDIEAAAALEGGDFLRAWIEFASAWIEAPEHAELLEEVKKELVERLSFLDLLNWFWSKEWLDDQLEREEFETWKELHNALLKERPADSITLHLYLQEMDLKSKAPTRLPGSIPCLTVHGAKGLEFKHVFLIGMAEDVFPSFHAVRKGDSSHEIEEERRNCFVAITRAAETLHLTWAKTYNGYSKKPSRFIQEMGFTVR